MKVNINNKIEFEAIINESNNKIILVTHEKTFQQVKENIINSNSIYTEDEECKTSYSNLALEQITEFADGTIKMIFGGTKNEE